MSDLSPAAKQALTNAAAWQRASGDVRAECMPHIDDAQMQVQNAPKDKRKGMLVKLPDHIRELVEERLTALWLGDEWGAVMFASDNSEDAWHDACVYLEQTGFPVEAVRRLPKNNALWVVARKSIYMPKKVA